MIEAGLDLTLDWMKNLIKEKNKQCHNAMFLVRQGQSSQ